MITQYQVSSLIRNEIPQLADKVCPSKISLEVYAFMNYFSDYTRHAVEEHNFNLAKKCFNLAEKLYRFGDNIVRMLVENIFVYAFTAIMPTDKTEKLIIKSIIPTRLYSVYMKQVMRSGS